MHHRRTIRLKGYDYAQAGTYFVTLISHKRAHLFAEVGGLEIRLSEFGLVLEGEWRRLEKRFSGLVLDEFVVMPDHFHGIVILSGEAARKNQPGGSYPSHHAPPIHETQLVQGTKPGSLGAVIGAYKSSTARNINAMRRSPGAPVWQRNYYEHIVREPDELARIRAYIQANPNRWVEANK